MVTALILHCIKAVIMPRDLGGNHEDKERVFYEEPKDKQR